jgi:hypothetical protein
VCGEVSGHCSAVGDSGVLGAICVCVYVCVCVRV